MARQKSFLKFTGRIGDVSFYKSPDGYMAREKGGVDGDRIATDPAFQRTRENGAEFGTAGRGGKLIRNSMMSLVKGASDRLAVGRFTKQLVKAVQEDGTSARGKRNLLDGNLMLAEGFDFNIDAKLGSTFLAPYTIDVDRVTGKLDISIPVFDPTLSLIPPIGTTHFKIVSAGSEVDFISGATVASRQDSAMLPLTAGNIAAAITLSNTVTANTTKPLFLSLGVEFYQHVNGVDYILQNSQYNPLQLVKVDLV